MLECLVSALECQRMSEEGDFWWLVGWRLAMCCAMSCREGVCAVGVLVVVGCSVQMWWHLYIGGAMLTRQEAGRKAQ